MDSQITQPSRNSLRLLFWAGALGVTASLLTAIYVSVRVFINPAPFASSAWDMRWALAFLGLVLVSGLSIGFRRGRLLIGLTGVAILGLLVVAVIRSGAGPAFLLLIWWMTASTALGSWLLTRLALSLPALERFLLSLTLGFGGFMLLGLLLGVLHLYEPAIAYALLALITLLLVPSLLRSFYPGISEALHRGRELWQDPKADLRSYALAGSLLAICAIGPYLWSLAPTIRYDALTYHLAVPVAYIRNHGMVDLGTFNSYWAHYAEMLYTYAMLLLGQPLPGLLHLTAGLLTTAWSFALGKRLASTRAGLLAGLLFFSLPMVGYETGTVYIDLFVALFIVAMVSAGVIWWQSGEIRWLAVAGILAGFALGTKLTAAPIVFILGVFLVPALVLRYRKLSTALTGFLALALPTVLITAPWLLRDWLWTGNPVYPFFNSLFPGQSVAGSTSVGFQGVSSRFLIRMVRLPWDLMFNIHTYDHKSPGAVLGALPWLALPWLYLWTPGSSSRQRRWHLTLFLFSIAAILVLFDLNPLARYQIPLYPLFAICAALNLDALWRWLSQSCFKVGWGALGLTLLLVYVFSTRLALTVRATDFPERFPLKVFLGMETPQSFLSRSLPVYDTFQYLNQVDGGQHKVISLGNDFKLYTTSQIDGVGLTPKANQLIAGATSAADLASRLADNGYDYLLVNQAEVEYSPGSYTFPALDQDFFDRYTWLEFANQRVYLYRLYPQGVPASLQSRNLLQNPGFEQIDANGQVAAWSAIGAPRPDHSGGQAHSGVGTIELHGPIPQSSYSYISQEVTADARKAYTVGYWARSDTAMSLMLQIQWLDIDHKLISEEVEWKPLQAQWSWYALSSQAPDGARFARVFASASGDGSAWFDDVCFTQGGNCPGGESVFTPP